MPDIAARCCIAGGGPAGMMLGFLLARAGIDVVVLEKHGDFLRDFRGDTVHPSTMQVMHELGLLDAFLARPHSEVRELAAQIGEQLFKVADFSHLPTQANFVAFMPQWDFLDFLADHAKRYPTFRLLMNTEATGLMREDDRMVGVTAEGPEGRLEVNAHLTIAADGRHSTLRDGAGFEVVEYGAPMDVLWLRLSKRQNDPGQTLGRVDVGRIFIMLDRGDYWQCAFIIPKGGIDDVHARGLDAFRADITRLAPYLTGPRAGARDVGRREAADRGGEPAEYLVSSRAAVHRRCGACDVAGWRRRYQPGDPGRGRRGEHPGAATARGWGHTGRSACRTTPPRTADADDAARSGG